MDTKQILTFIVENGLGAKDAILMNHEDWDAYKETVDPVVRYRNVDMKRANLTGPRGVLLAKMNNMMKGTLGFLKDWKENRLPWMETE